MAIIVPGMKVKVISGPHCGERGRILFPAQIKKTDGIPEIEGIPLYVDWSKELPVLYECGKIGFIQKSHLIRV